MKLPVKKSPNRCGPDAHGELILYDVLHCPGGVCNIIGLTTLFLESYGVTMGKSPNRKSSGNIKDKEGKNVAYFDGKETLFQVKLSGPPIGPVVGPHVLREGIFVLTMRWSETERARWEIYKDKRDTKKASKEPQNESRLDGRASGQDQCTIFQTSLSNPENQWLKKYYGGEFHFLRDHGLNIHKEEDREEGRSLMRQLMSNDMIEMEGHVDEDEDDNDDDDEESDEDLQGHVADYAFDEKCLEWIEKHYGNSERFMLCYGLKFYNDEDCQEAAQIARTLMAPDRCGIVIPSAVSNANDGSDPEKIRCIVENYGSFQKIRRNMGLKSHKPSHIHEALFIRLTLSCLAHPDHQKYQNVEGILACPLGLVAEFDFLCELHQITFTYSNSNYFYPRCL